MKPDDAKFDETEPAGGSMVRLSFRAWTMAPQFEYLNAAPTDEAETCDALSPEGVALERRDSNGPNAKRFIRTSFSCLDEFRRYAGKELVFFHVFDGKPNAAVFGLLSEGDESERVVLLDVGNDLGFLTKTPVTVGVVSDRRPIAKMLAELRGLGAWAKGVMFGFEENEAAMGPFISKARAFVRIDL